MSDVTVDSTVPSISNEDTLDYGWKMFGHLTAQIQNADTKASLILGVDAILIGILAALVAERVKTLPSHLFATPDVISVFLLGLSLLLLGGSIYAALVVTRPSVSRSKESGLFYFTMIRAFSREEFIKRFETMKPQDILDDLLSQVHSLAGITQKKYRRNALSLNLLLACLYLWGLAQILTVLG